MFYDVYCALCEKNGLTPSGAASKIGFNRASVTVWFQAALPIRSYSSDFILFMWLEINISSEIV